MTPFRSIVCACCVLATFLLAAPSALAQPPKPDANGFIAANPEDLRPAEGGRSINILGDPGKPGMYVVRITFPPGAGSKPHFHSQDRYVTVISGTWWVSLGPDSDVYNPDKMVPMKAGSFILHPANGHHYDMAKDEAVTVQIIGMGPVTTTQVKPQ
jgi:quercetin dioxygenase-like cupin family protein